MPGPSLALAVRAAEPDCLAAGTLAQLSPSRNCRLLQGPDTEREVIEQTDHRNFNIDVPYMQGINPTTENVVVAMWQVLAPAIAPAQLIRLRLWETENNYVDYEGE